MAKAKVIDSPLLGAVVITDKPTKKSAKAEPAEYKPPSHQERKVERAHMAHQDVVEKWVKGETTSAKVKQSKSRLQQVCKGRM